MQHVVEHNSRSILCNKHLTHYCFIFINTEMSCYDITTYIQPDTATIVEPQSPFATQPFDSALPVIHNYMTTTTSTQITPDYRAHFCQRSFFLVYSQSSPVHTDPSAVVLRTDISNHSNNNKQRT